MKQISRIHRLQHLAAITTAAGWLVPPREASWKGEWVMSKLQEYTTVFWALARHYRLTNDARSLEGLRKLAAAEPPPQIGRRLAELG